MRHSAGNARERKSPRSVVGPPDERRRAAAVVPPPKYSERIYGSDDPIRIGRYAACGQGMSVTALRPAAIVIPPHAVTPALFKDVRIWPAGGIVDQNADVAGATGVAEVMGGLLICTADAVCPFDPAPIRNVLPVAKLAIANPAPRTYSISPSCGEPPLASFCDPAMLDHVSVERRQATSSTFEPDTRRMAISPPSPEPNRFGCQHDTGWVAFVELKAHGAVRVVDQLSSAAPEFQVCMGVGLCPSGRRYAVPRSGSYANDS